MLGNLGNYELAADDLDAARRHLAESLDIARALNAATASSTGHSTLAWPSTSAARRARPRPCSRNHSTWPGAWG